MGLLFCYFLIYSFFGFLFEITFARLTHSKKQDRKCHLLLPVCPVYGLGAMAILSLPSIIRQNAFLLYLFGGLTATAIEWLVAVFYEKGTGALFWDYHTLPFNLNGRVCLWFSLFWGVLALLLVYRVHPFLVPIINRIPKSLILPIISVYLSDALVSLHVLRHQGTDGLKWYARLKPSEAR